ncbi:hypothetical protein HK103_007396 [Boothiomyces macroporosus]|uniref:Xylose isomerase-like TIM barrel domain-containing protein n=1 Tax=Boothiomyces macroporosus TaxID=261099 RepID=A0AAD5UNI6_9FUNG|nr:hypothetical protein HK103_007396 [Boothiomyces macroporosus]
MVEAFRSLWGMGPDWETVFPLLKQQGFVGVEASIKDTQYPSPRFFNLLAENDLKWICGLYTSWTDYEGPCESISVDQHVKNFKSQVEILKSVPVKPIHVNCHSGSDEFSQEEAETYFNAVLEIQAESEFTYSHETHRGLVS